MGEVQMLPVLLLILFVQVFHMIIVILQVFLPLEEAELMVACLLHPILHFIS